MIHEYQTPVPGVLRIFDATEPVDILASDADRSLARVRREDGFEHNVALSRVDFDHGQEGKS